MSDEFDRNTMIAKDMTQLIGNTPMVYLNKMNDTKATIALKMESMNPMASVKDRLAHGILDKAEKEGKIKPGESVIIEATSGNTGIGLGFVGAIRGYRVIITMPETMSLERRCLLKILGCDLILTPAANGVKGAVIKSREIAAVTPNAVLADQFATPANAAVHKETTGPEIWKQTQGKIDYFVAGVGTGGTITGVAQYLKEQGSEAKCVAVEPAESPVLSGGKPGPHKIQGIGAGFVPDVLEKGLLSEIIQCPSAVAMEVAQALPKSEGVFCGFSGGANVYAALQLARRPENEGKLIVAVIPSFGERYLSTALFDSVKNEAANIPTSAVSM